MKRFPTQEQIARSLSKAEEALNLLGYIPMVSIASAAVRTLGGKLQALGGLCYAVWNFFKMRPFRAKMGLEYLFHGVCNIVRAMIEAVPFLSLATCLPYDRVFKKRFKYSGEDSEIIDIS
ncbi:MAG: hypothetical protein HYX67_02990 [Candidatus Melainabacteria bacterium]|nr:hypothetical protein [Candidatus Melainabacteria bacterium]